MKIISSRIEFVTIERIGELITHTINCSSLFIVTDTCIARLHLYKLIHALQRCKLTCTTYILPIGEQSKSFTHLQHLVEYILSYKPDRNTLLIAFGGGVVTDITGLAASIILRGVRFICIPTTLLAQVDSAIGGKTAIDSKYGKNLIGSFWQPILVLIDISFLSTLSKREFASGYAEVVKYALIRDISFFMWLQNNATAILQKHNTALHYIVQRSCQIKQQIIANDLYDQNNQRALLNFGHTLGHALEAVSRYTLPHGEAVAIGMIYAIKLSGLDCSIVMNHLNVFSLPTNIKALPFVVQKTTLKQYLLQDKKIYNGKLHFILLKKLGSAYLSDCITFSDIEEILE